MWVRVFILYLFVFSSHAAQGYISYQERQRYKNVTLSICLDLEREYQLGSENTHIVLQPKKIGGLDERGYLKVREALVELYERKAGGLRNGIDLVKCAELYLEPELVVVYSEVLSVEFIKSQPTGATMPTFNRYRAANGGYSDFIDFGVWFGGGRVAVNPDGDNYKAGGGAIMGFGKIFKPFDIEGYSIESKNMIALRYQGAKTGKGENRGLVLESLLTLNRGLGFGLHFDFANVVSDQFGAKTEFKSSLGVVLSYDWELEGGLGISAKYLFADFETKNNVLYAGDQFGIFAVLYY